MRSLKPAAAMLSVGLLAGACSSAHEKATPSPRPIVESPTPTPSIEPITGEPEARARALAALALTRFERNSTKARPALTWVYKNTCELIDEDPGGEGPHSIEVVPNPGVLRIVDKQTGNMITQDFGWDQQEHKYVTGRILAIRNKQTFGWVSNGHDEFSIYFPNDSFVFSRLHYSEQRNLLVHGSDSAQYANVVAVSGDATAKAAQDDPVVNFACAAVIAPNTLQSSAPAPSA